MSSVCYNLCFIDCQHGNIRLVRIGNPLEGRLEVCYEGVWGTVCGGGFGAADAAVICRQLGYSSYGMIQRKTDTWFRMVIGQIHNL